MLFAFAFVPVQRAIAQNRATAQSLPADLSRLIEDILDEADIPGAAIVVIEDRDIAFAADMGVTNLETRSPVTDQTVFRAGSISKSFTSIAVMQLVEAGRLDLQTPVSEILPELPISNPWSATDPVRVVHLLEHTGGFNDIAFRHYLIEGADLTIADAVRLYEPYRSRWRPGERTSYSNAGPVIAGRIVEVVSGQSFEDYMAKNVLGPMGMASASWIRSPEVSRRLSSSYFWDGSREEPFVEIAGRPSGSLNVTARDLAKLPLLMLLRGSFDGKSLLSPASVDRIERPRSATSAKAGLRFGYALGNDVNLNGKTTFYGHDGSIDGFVATARYSPELGAGYVVMLNQTSSAMEDVAAVIREYLERGVDAAAVGAKPMPENLLAAVPGQYQTSTPRRSFLAPLIGLSQWQGARFENGKLYFKGEEWSHVGDGLFQAKGQSAPGLLAIQNAQGVSLETGTATYRSVDGFEMWAKIGALALVGAITFLAAIYFLLWGWAAIRGKLSGKDAIGPRLFPSLALAAALGAAIAPLMLFGTGSFELLGKPTTIGWAVFGITTVAPVLVVSGAIILWRSDVGHAAKIIGAVQIGAAALICGYLMHGDWFALRIWNA